MKDVRPEFNTSEYERLTREASALGVSVKRLVHDRALGISTADTPLSVAKKLSDEISLCRDAINQIARREMAADIRLYEDDIIRLEMEMANIEAMVSAILTQTIKEAK